MSSNPFSAASPSTKDNKKEVDTKPVVQTSPPVVDTSENHHGLPSPSEPGGLELVVDRNLPQFSMEEATCRTCAYYFFGKDAERAFAANGECRRQAPNNFRAKASWPGVRWETWCGEWEMGVSQEEMVRMARDMGDYMGEEEF